MRSWIADQLLRASTGLYVASVWCRDKALALLISRNIRRQKGKS